MLFRSYTFGLNNFSIIVIQTSDNLFYEFRVINIYKDSNDKINFVVDSTISDQISSELVSSNVKKVLFLIRKEDETNTYVIYQKRPGKTSYGFIIPSNLSPEVLAKIDTITRQVKQKLINEYDYEIDGMPNITQCWYRSDLEKINTHFVIV